MGNITCPPRAKPNKMTKLKCELNRPTKFGMIWVRPDDKMVVTCNLTKKVCNVQRCCSNKYFATDIGYQKSTLFIRKFNPMKDAGVWHCRYAHSGGQDSCNLTIGG